MVHKYKWKRKQYIFNNTGSTMELLLFHAATNNSFHIIYNSFLKKREKSKQLYGFLNLIFSCNIP